MDFSNFEKEFLLQLKNKDNNCLKLIENNQELIKENLGNDADSKKLDNFVNVINNIILEIENNKKFPIKSSLLSNKNKNNFKLVEDVLKHPYFSKVLDTFNNSNILVRACQAQNKSVAKWLLENMNISPYIQDDDGVSAQMYAAKCGFNFIIEPILNNARCLNLEDKNGNNVLFYAIHNPKLIPNDGISKFVTDLINSEIDINHFNHKGETILTYCIKNDIFKPIEYYILRNPNIDVNVADNVGVTPAMYLARKGRYKEFVALHQRGCNYDYINMNGESALSIIMKNLYSPEEYRKGIPYEKYVRLLSAIVNFQSDFNIPIDRDENTAFMVSLIVNDLYTFTFCAKCLKKLDLSIKNKYGESVTSLVFKLRHYELLPFFKNNPTFDYHYRDSINHNTLLMLSAISKPTVMKELLENDPSIINEVNIKNENALIIATKVNSVAAVNILLEQGIYVNQQDGKGNTALHYAVETQKPYLVHQLVVKNSDIHIKNNEKKSPLDIAKELGNEEIIKVLTDSSYVVNKTQSNKDIDNIYYDEVQKYLKPYINNEYPEFESTRKMNNTKIEIYGHDTGNSTNLSSFLLFLL